MQKTRELILTAYAAFNRREIDAVLALMHPRVDWPNGMEGGRVIGRAEVRAYWERQWAMIDPCVRPLYVDEDGAGHTVVDVHQVVHDLSGNLLLDQHIQHVYQIRDGLIQRMDIRESVIHHRT